MINLRGRLVELTRPWVMGILNVTPDSFYEPSRVSEPVKAVARVGEMLDAGADIIDIGACSTRPGARLVSPEEEMKRLSAALEAVRAAYPDAVISVDTFRASVARECLSRWNVEIINDISGGDDPEMYDVVARHGAVYVLMHKRGLPEDMDTRCEYGDVVADVVRELAFRLNEARKAGICDVIVDPGFGFAKTVGQNLRLLDNLELFRELGCPLLVGISHKRMTGSLTDSEVPTVTLNAVALYKGANIIRVHDVEAGVSTAQTIGKLWNLE